MRTLLCARLLYSSSHACTLRLQHYMQLVTLSFDQTQPLMPCTPFPRLVRFLSKGLRVLQKDQCDAEDGTPTADFFCKDLNKDSDLQGVPDTCYGNVARGHCSDVGNAPDCLVVQPWSDQSCGDSSALSAAFSGVNATEAKGSYGIVYGPDSMCLNVGQKGLQPLNAPAYTGANAVCMQVACTANGDSYKVLVSSKDGEATQRLDCPEGQTLQLGPREGYAAGVRINLLAAQSDGTQHLICFVEYCAFCSRWQGSPAQCTCHSNCNVHVCKHAVAARPCTRAKPLHADHPRTMSASWPDLPFPRLSRSRWKHVQRSRAMLPRHVSLRCRQIRPCLPARHLRKGWRLQEGRGMQCSWRVLRRWRQASVCPACAAGRGRAGALL